MSMPLPPTVVALAVPLADTISCVPDEITRFVVEPDASTLTMAPLLKVEPLRLPPFSVKPDPISSTPLEPIVSPLNSAPPSRSSVPPDSTVSPNAEPVFDTIALPPVEIVAALSRPADTVAEPPELSTAALAVPPDSTRLPLLPTVVALAEPLADTISCVPDEIVRFDVTPEA